jgi:SAM-dependent methyltransferase
MVIRPLMRLLRQGQLFGLMRAGMLFRPFYTVVYLAALKQNGILALLSERPMGFEQIAAAYGQDAKTREALTAWLQMGVRLRLLSLGSSGYALKGAARTLAESRNDAALALVEEAADLHYRLIAGTLPKLQAGTFWALSDQDGDLTARSSRVLEAFQVEAIEKIFPQAGAVRLLEVGCGSGVYIRHAAQRNPLLSAVGLELQGDVAETAAANIRSWGLAGRVRIEVGDVRDWQAEETFDVVTLYNNIYYFPVGERVALLGGLRRFLGAGGMLVVTTSCQGGSVGVEALNLWGAATGTGGRLPEVAEMVGQLRDAGYVGVEAIRFTPGDRFYAFRGLVG